MKKAMLVLAAVFTGAFLLSACGSGKACPAYSKVNKSVEARPC